MNCSFCNNTFTNKGILMQHQKNAKYCLLLQGLENNNFNCIYCEKKYSTKQTLDTHQHNCSNKKIKELNKELTESKEKEIQELKKEKDKEIKELKKDIKKLTKLSQEKEKDIKKITGLTEEKDKHIEELKIHIKELENKLENKLENIAIKIGSKPQRARNFVAHHCK